uniref:Uncharacterized protein n=1 Tax=Oryza meridionalis TaxID=40149 RepID=A0A0E0DZV3_9ORYZ
MGTPPLRLFKAQLLQYDYSEATRQPIVLGSAGLIDFCRCPMRRRARPPSTPPGCLATSPSITRSLLPPLGQNTAELDAGIFDTGKLNNCLLLGELVSTIRLIMNCPFISYGWRCHR